MPASATRKTPARKPTRKVAAERAAAKSASKTTVRMKRAVSPEIRSFRAARSSEPFLTFQITHQTFYWLILAVLAVGLAAWVMSISIKVQHIYDQIDATNQLIDTTPVTRMHKAAH